MAHFRIWLTATGPGKHVVQVEADLRHAVSHQLDTGTAAMACDELAIAVDQRALLARVDDPYLTDAISQIRFKLLPAIEATRAVTDLDDQLHLVGARFEWRTRFNDGDVRLWLTIVRQDNILQPALHVAIDTLSDDAVPQVLKRMLHSPRRPQPPRPAPKPRATPGRSHPR